MSRFWVSKSKYVIINIDHIVMIERNPPQTTVAYLVGGGVQYLDDADTQSLLDLIATDKR